MAASSISLLSIGLAASAAVAQYQAVTAAGAPAVAAGNAVGFAPVGGAIGERIQVEVLGTTKAVAGGVIAPGALVEIHTTVTQVVTRSAGVSVGRYIGAAACASGDVIEILILPN